MTKKKTQSLSEFVEDIQQDIKKFEADYRAHNEKEPENYPLEIPLNDSGLWFEFFMDFVSKED